MPPILFGQYKSWKQFPDVSYQSERRVVSQDYASDSVFTRAERLEQVSRPDPEDCARLSQEPGVSLAPVVETLDHRLALRSGLLAVQGEGVYVGLGRERLPDVEVAKIDLGLTVEARGVRQEIDPDGMMTLTTGRIFPNAEFRVSANGSISGRLYPDSWAQPTRNLQVTEGEDGVWEVRGPDVHVLLRPPLSRRWVVEGQATPIPEPSQDPAEGAVLEGESKVEVLPVDRSQEIRQHDYRTGPFKTLTQKFEVTTPRPETIHRLRSHLQPGQVVDLSPSSRVMDSELILVGGARAVQDQEGGRLYDPDGQLVEGVSDARLPERRDHSLRLAGAGLFTTLESGGMMRVVTTQDSPFPLASLARQPDGQATGTQYEAPPAKGFSEVDIEVTPTGWQVDSAFGAAVLDVPISVDWFKKE